MKKEKVVWFIRIWNDGTVEEVKGKQLENLLDNEHKAYSCLIIREAIYGKTVNVKWKKMKFKLLELLEENK